ncbi:uncharacterized protein J3R85_018489 [Psidium guajava]|nr:uncharacterized protein J3R85_018489 [Psidium guajava]
MHQLPPPRHLDCDEACAVWCHLSSPLRLCKRACGTCCDCMPPGTSSNYDACPCYANMTSHGGRPKCPGPLLGFRLQPCFTCGNISV